MIKSRGLQLVLVLVFVSACSRESMIRGALEDPSERRDTMRTTLKIYDEHPEYVDELFAAAREHEATFQRLLQRAAIALEDPAFATLTAGPIAERPLAAEHTTRATLAAARTRPELRRALANALVAEGDVMSLILAEHPQLLQQVFMGGSRRPSTVQPLTPTPVPTPPAP